MIVATKGLEPLPADPESAVLPLHHAAIKTAAFIDCGMFNILFNVYVSILVSLPYTPAFHQVHVPIVVQCYEASLPCLGSRHSPARSFGYATLSHLSARSLTHCLSSGYLLVEGLPASPFLSDTSVAGCIVIDLVVKGGIEPPTHPRLLAET